MLRRSVYPPGRDLREVREDCTFRHLAMRQGRGAGKARQVDVCRGLGNPRASRTNASAPRRDSRREKPYRQEQPAPCVACRPVARIEYQLLLKHERTRLRRSSAAGEDTPMRWRIVLLSSMLLLASACSNQEPREVLPRPAGVAPNASANIPSAPGNDRSSMTTVPDRTHDAAAKTSERVVAPAAPAKGGKNDSSPFSTLEGSTIALQPSGIKFDVPADWVWNEQRSRLHLSRSQLAKVEKPDFDKWNREFGPDCNAALPFDRCAAHVGREPLGDDGRRFDNLQVRVYDLPHTTSQVEDRIAHGVNAAVSEKKNVRRETNGSWRGIFVSYSRPNFDYEVTAHIDIVLASAGDRTLAFVFIYTGSLKKPDSIAMILKSVRRG